MARSLPIPTWSLTTVLVLVVCGALLAGCAGDRTRPGASSPPQPGSVTRLTVPAPGDVRCMSVTSEFLAGQADVAVDATVAEVTGDEVVLTPARWFRGEPTETLTLSGPSAALEGLVPGVGFVEGERYLVAGAGGRTMICGFSGPWTAAQERLYVDAFGS